MIHDASTRDEREVLEDRLRWAAESLTVEFQGISKADAERLVFEVAEQFLSDAKVAQFVPTFATRRARHLLRSGLPERTALAQALIAPPSDSANGMDDAPADLEVIVEDDPIEVETSHLDAVRPATTSTGPPRPPAYYATEARRLLEKAKVLRATAVVPGGRAD